MMAEYFIFGLALLFGVIGYLLSRRDAKQAEEIETLFKLHHADEKQLHNLELEIARNHYPKNELDERFKQLDQTMKDGFGSLGADIKEMVKALNAHLQDRHNGGRGQ